MSASSQPSSPPARRRRLLGPRVAWGLRLLLMLAMVAAAVWAVWVGIDLRRATFHTTEQVRFRSDISRGYEYGRRAWTDGYADVYDRVLAYEAQTGEDVHLNYGPFRLLAMSLWAGINDNGGNGHDRWHRDHAFSAPVLRLNTGMELASAALAFVLVWLWVRRGWAARAEPDQPALASQRRWITRQAVAAAGLGLLAAGLIWFNPASLANAHGWPLWDIWVVPFFLAAVLLISFDRWFLAGVVIAVGAMFKGQQLIIAPWFLLTALMMGRPDALWRWLCGFVGAFGVCVGVWMLGVPYELADKVATDPLPLRDPAGTRWNRWAIAWVVAVGGLMSVMGTHHWWRGCSRRLGWGIAAGAAALLLALFLLASGGRWWWAASPIIAGLAVLVVWYPRRLHGPTVALAMGVALLLCVPLFGASTGWLTIGFMRGTELFPVLQVADAHNIAGILTEQFGLDNRQALDLELFTLGRGALGWCWPLPDLTVTLPGLMKAVFFVALVVAAFAAARHLRRGDPRFLAAAVFPWLAMFLILPQMHERYLLFGTLLGAVLVAVDWRFTLMTVFLAFSTTLMTLRTMINNNHYRWRGRFPRGDWSRESIEWVRDVAREAYPGMAWGVLICGVIVLLVALKSPRPYPARTPPSTSSGHDDA